MATCLSVARMFAWLPLSSGFRRVEDGATHSHRTQMSLWASLGGRGAEREGCE